MTKNSEDEKIICPLASVLLHSVPYCLFSTCDPCLTISCKAVTWNVFSSFFHFMDLSNTVACKFPANSARVSPTKREANPFVPLLVVTSNMIFIFKPVCQITCLLKFWGNANWCCAIQQKLWKGNVVSC